MVVTLYWRTQQHTPQIPSKNFFSNVSEAQNSTTWHYLFTGTGRWTSSTSSSRMFKIFFLPKCSIIEIIFVLLHFQSLVTQSWTSKHINVSGMYGYTRCISTCFQLELLSRISIQNNVWLIFKRLQYGGIFYFSMTQLCELIFLGGCIMINIYCLFWKPIAQ